MFHFTRRCSAALPLIWLLSGVIASPLLLMLASALALMGLLLRHRHILARVGNAPWASIGFARHVMVDDLLRLAGLMALSPVVYFSGQSLGKMVLGAH